MSLALPQASFPTELFPDQPIWSISYTLFLGAAEVKWWLFSLVRGSQLLGGFATCFSIPSLIHCVKGKQCVSYCGLQTTRIKTTRWLICHADSWAAPQTHYLSPCRLGPPNLYFVLLKNYWIRGYLPLGGKGDEMRRITWNKFISMEFRVIL